MAAFTELDWGRIDVRAIVTHGGLATIDERRHDACREWLIRNGYTIVTFDCRPGLDVAVPELCWLLHWEEQFGYLPEPGRRSLDALRDGFEFAIPEAVGVVLEVLRPDIAWQEDPHWLCGLLSIAQEQCRLQLARDRRFFALLVVPEHSPLIGAVIEPSTVPPPYWNPSEDLREFRR